MGTPKEAMTHEQKCVLAFNELAQRFGVVKESIEECQRFMATNRPNDRAKKLLQGAYLLVGRAKMASEGRPVFLCDADETTPQE